MAFRSFGKNGIWASKYDFGTLSLCILVHFPLQINAVRIGFSIIYFKGSKVEEISNNICTSFPEDCFCISKQCRPCSIMLHFIWVFAVRKSTRFGVSRIQRIILHLQTGSTVTQCLTREHSDSVLDSRLKGCGFEPHQRHINHA